MIMEDCVGFETSKLLKEKGFDECPLFHYDDCGQIWIPGGYDKTKKWHFPAPTLQMTRKWLREKHHLHIEIRITNDSISDMVNVVKYYWVMTNTETGRWCDESTIYTVKVFDKSEEAEEDAIRHALEKYV